MNILYLHLNKPPKFNISEAKWHFDMFLTSPDSCQKLRSYDASLLIQTSSTAKIKRTVHCIYSSIITQWKTSIWHFILSCHWWV